MNQQDPILQAIGISKSFGKKSVLEEISFDLLEGETICVMGPSGTGKTSLLRILSGLDQPSSGRVHLAGTDVTLLPPEQRNIGFVHQHYALFPHLSVFENLAFPLKLRKVPKDQIAQQVAEALQWVEMDGMEDRRPGMLSGGEQQRVAILRALIYKPGVLLLDEPFAALDQYLVDKLQTELLLLRDRLKIAMILVTHDSPFAISFSDRIMILSEGQIQQFGSPRVVFERPMNRFVAGFLGPANLIPGDIVGESNGYAKIKIYEGSVFEAAANNPLPSRQAILLIRPNKVKINASGANNIQAKIRAIQYRGTNLMLEASLVNGAYLHAEIPTNAGAGLVVGSVIHCSWDKSDAFILPG